MKINVKQLDIEINKAQTLYKRAIGFMFRRQKIMNGLVFPKCNAIHTFFMFQPIDVVMTDIDYNILYKYENLKPGHIIWPQKGVYYTYELPIGSIKKIGSK
jgi:uncharacterized membrane protein (UPF0127 family)